MGSNPCRISGCDEWVHNSDSACVSHYNELQDKLTAATKKIEALREGIERLHPSTNTGFTSQFDTREFIVDEVIRYYKRKVTALLTETEEKKDV